ncbi:MAG TPA: hypothetical protein VIK91_05735, partial [Nannocystis sp.]
VERAWPALVRSQLMRMQIPRIDAHLLRASAALAAARHARACDPRPPTTGRNAGRAFLRDLLALARDPLDGRALSRPRARDLLGDRALLRNHLAFSRLRPSGPRDERALLRTARAAAAALARERITLARAAEALIRGQLAVLEGVSADELLHAAADRFAAGAMPTLATAVRLGAAPPPARAQAARALADCGVREPERWSAAVAPVLFATPP